MAYSIFKSVPSYKQVSLHPDFLTTAQLYLIDFSKLVVLRCLNNQVNERVDDVIISRINNDLVTPSDLKHFSTWDTQSLFFPKRKEDFIDAYNNFYQRHFSLYEKGDKLHLLNWNLLSDKNKLNECRFFVDGKYNIVNTQTIDYDWLYEQDYFLAQRLADKVATNRPYSPNAIIRLFEKLPRQEVHRLESVAYYIEATLASPFVSDAVAPKALREFSKKKSLRFSINYVISFEELESLPPVTTLKLIDKIVSIGNVEPLKNINEEQLGLLLFSTSLRYNWLVSTTLKKYKALIGEQT